MRPSLLVPLLLLAFGLVRWPLESAATRDFKARGLLPVHTGLALRERMTQNSYAAVLGGARSFIASMENLRAFTAWENQDWGKVEAEYRLVTDLQPGVASYWEMAGWHLAYNASGYYRYDWEGPGGGATPEAVQRLRMDLWARYIRKGQEFLRDGVRNNPANWQLASYAGLLWGDPWKLPDHVQSAHYYGLAARMPGAPTRLRRFEAYALSFIPGRQDEARARLEALYRESERNHLPNLLATLLDLQMAAGVPPDQRVPLSKIPSPGQDLLGELKAYRESRRFQGGEVSAPMRALIESLEAGGGRPPAGKAASDSDQNP